MGNVAAKGKNITTPAPKHNDMNMYRGVEVYLTLSALALPEQESSKVSTGQDAGWTSYAV
jgi:hypothetical protein